MNVWTGGRPATRFQRSPECESGGPGARDGLAAGGPKARSGPAIYWWAQNQERAGHRRAVDPGSGQPTVGRGPRTGQPGPGHRLAVVLPIGRTVPSGCSTPEVSYCRVEVG